MMNAINDRRQKYWHPSWIEPDPHYRNIRIDHTIRALTLARELGARCITTEPGGPVEPGGSWKAALQLFAERGYHGTSVPSVMERAGVGGGSLYRLFESKEVLVNAVFRDAKGRLESALRAASIASATGARQTGAATHHRRL